MSAAGAATLISLVLVQPFASAVGSAIVQPSTVAFGGVPVGGTSNQQLVTITSLTSTPLTINGIAVPSPFTEVSSTCTGVPLGFIQSCSVSIVFSPTAAGGQSGLLTFGTSAGPFTASLSGMGTTVPTSLLPQTIAFSSTAPVNPVGGTYTVSATASSGLPVAFSIDGLSTLNACSIAGNVVSFTGPGLCLVDANQSGSSIFAAAPQVQQSIMVAAPTSAAAPQLSASSLFFGSVNVGTTSNPQSVTITNNDALHTLGVTSVSAVGPFSVSGCSGANVGFLQQCTISVTFKPTGTGPTTGLLTITDNGGTGSQTVFLSGSGTTPVATLFPQTIIFTSNPPANPISGTYNVTATASSGLPVTFSLDAATTNGACSVSGSTVTFLAPGSCVVDANQAGNAEFSAAPQVQQHITVVASTPTSTPAFSATSLSFGAVKVGSTSAAQTLTVTNFDPNHTLIIPGGNIFGPFGVLGGTCLTTTTFGFLQSCTLVLTFDPFNAGPATGSVVFNDNAVGGQQTVNLTGTGI